MKAGIALGTNIEPRLLHLQEARRRLLALSRPGTPALASKVYETAPVDCPEESAAFLNAVMEIESDLTPHQLLGKLQEIEIAMGRPKEHPKNSPRPIDLDLLYCDNVTLSDRDLILPHPRMTTRRFVLQPLADIRPDFIPPNFTKKIEEFLKEQIGDDYFKIYTNSIY